MPAPPPIWQQTSAWREILARAFAGVETKYNVYPDWLINPATNRRLKLDLLYPTLGVAIRFEGQDGKQRKRRPSLEEEEQEAVREEAREEVCRRHGVELITIDPSDSPKNLFRQLDLGLSRAAHYTDDETVIAQLKQVRAEASSLMRRVRTGKDIKLYADLWDDRQYKLTEAEKDAPVDAPKFSKGMVVEHVVFGPGMVLNTEASGEDQIITVEFEDGSQKTFMASLVADKLLVA